MSYLRLILLPMNQNLDPKLEWSNSIADGRVLLSAAFLIAIIVAAWLAYRRRTASLRASLILLFTLFFFTSLAISSGLVPLPDVMAEHRTYKSSIGMLVVLVALLDLAHVADKVGRIGRHLLTPSMESLLDLARAAENYSHASPKVPVEAQ